ncbi:DUF58 domain-containing protein [Alkaliphilus peptidifermentans]|uniref:Uncharacterized conserved protein, DUF58 family, contains vWF domain n=1 Tax=Alkaliphilus peptidifermentans DSM 18978 TaxID=1120976 RepID=A0A1G5AM33_9FIRM|nr:DUF58 domain-containing protein [Alkaliphilus peptidifermentans]SCX78989.1 Uncharacterized conserved protein, DUF58 family, contains vWF domain [Alkaliphilus peptidifermentans DSM 18978]
MKAKALIILVGCPILLSVLLIGGRVPYFLFYLYLATIAIPAIHGYIGKLFLRGTVYLPEKELMTGEEIKIKYNFENNLPFSYPRLEFENNIAFRLTGVKAKKKVFYLMTKEEYRDETAVVCRRRGHYRVGEMNLIIKDIFNLFEFNKKILAPISLKVYPKIVPLNYFKILASQQMGELIVKEPTFQDYSAVSDLRTYQEGDSVKRIHWKASSKQEELMVKNFELRGDTEVVIILNNHSHDYLEDTDNWIEDTGVEVALSIIDYCLKRNMQVSLFFGSDSERTHVKGDSSVYLKNFMEALVEFSPMGNQPFSNQIEKLASGVRQGSSLLIITPVLTKNTGAQGIQLKMKNYNPSYIVIGDEINSPRIWNENKNISKKLESEGIPLYIINGKQDIRDVLGGKYEKGA